MDAKIAPSEKMEEARTDDSIISSYKVPEMIRDFTEEEYAMVRAASRSYLLVLETIAFIRKHRKESGHI